MTKDQALDAVEKAINLAFEKGKESAKNSLTYNEIKELWQQKKDQKETLKAKK